MAKFAGLVGYVTQEETTPGVWSPVEQARMMKGDFYMESSRHQNGDKINKDIALNHRVSLVGDAYTFENYYAIRWIEIKGVKWEVTSIEVKRPRLIVNIGGLYYE